MCLRESKLVQTVLNTSGQIRKVGKTCDHAEKLMDTDKQSSRQPSVAEFAAPKFAMVLHVESYHPCNLLGAAALDFVVTSGLRTDLLERAVSDGSSCLSSYGSFYFVWGLDF